MLTEVVLGNRLMDAEGLGFVIGAAVGVEEHVHQRRDAAQTCSIRADRGSGGGVFGVTCEYTT